jgi:hypothetical protein
MMHYLARHECTPKLFDVSPYIDNRWDNTSQGTETRRLYLSNNGADRSFVTAATDPEMRTQQQVAVALGVTVRPVRKMIDDGVIAHRPANNDTTRLVPTIELIRLLVSKTTPLSVRRLM